MNAPHFPLLHRFLVAIDEWSDARNRHDRSEQHTLYIQLYNGFANDTTAWLRGRVLIKHRRFRPAQPHDSIATNLLNTYFRIYSQEVGDVRLRLTVGEHSIEAVTDEEGYFDVAMPLNAPLPAGTNPIFAMVIDAPFEVMATEVAQSAVFIPSPDATFGVISDIDDTALVSETFSKWRTLYNVFIKNAYTRRAVEGVPAWYADLSNGGRNPFFYVSSSPWNLYDLLAQTLFLQKLPQGAIWLRDYGLDPDKFLLGAHSTHKRAAIDSILAAYPHLNFILSGDDIQHDPQIYAEAARDYGARILEVRIRKVKS
jgi:phosphatidate phosphatase APP1